jgi:RNA binding exosome subunit
MGTARKVWQELKKQMEDAPKFGKTWVAQNFKQDLGPTLDALESACDAYAADVDAFEKMMGKLEDREKDILELSSEVNTKLELYTKLVKAKAAAEKTKHGEQIDGLVFQMKKPYVMVHGPTQSKVMQLAKSVDRLWKNKIG